MTTEEGVTLFGIFVCLHYPSFPILPVTASFKHRSRSFLHCEKEKNELKKECHFQSSLLRLTAEACFCPQVLQPL